MTNTIQLKPSNFIKYLFYYFIVMLISNYIKTNYLINSLVLNSVDIALLSGHLSSIISSIFILLLLIIIVSICVFIIDVFFNEVKIQNIFYAIKTVIITFIVVEIIKIFLVYFVLLDEIKKIDISENIMEQLYDTNWYFYNSVLRTFIIYFGSIIFGIEIYYKEHKIIPSLIFSLIFLGCFYLINVDFFD